MLCFFLPLHLRLKVGGIAVSSAKQADLTLKVPSFLLQGASLSKGLNPLFLTAAALVSSSFQRSLALKGSCLSFLKQCFCCILEQGAFCEA